MRAVMVVAMKSLDRHVAHFLPRAHSRDWEQDISKKAVACNTPKTTSSNYSPKRLKGAFLRCASRSNWCSRPSSACAARNLATLMYRPRGRLFFHAEGLVLSSILALMDGSTEHRHMAQFCIGTHIRTDRALSNRHRHASNSPGPEQIVNADQIWRDGARNESVSLRHTRWISWRTGVLARAGG